MRNSSGFRNLLLFLLFVIIAALFWVVMAMNDAAQVNLDVNVRIVGKPDSLTFINLPPAKVHVTVRDKGTSLIRSAFARNPVVQFNFSEYASDGVLKLSASDIYSALRTRFGQGAQLTSLSVDSIKLTYTSLPPKTVPVEIESNLSAALGYIVESNLTPSRKFVKVYSTSQVQLDTLQRVHTMVIRKSNLSKTTNFRTTFQPISGVRIVPSSIVVTVPVEALVSKQMKVEVQPVNVPEGENISLFPSMVTVDAFVPMSRFNDVWEGMVLQVDYNDIVASSGVKRLPVKIVDTPKFVLDAKVTPSAVEYILVK